MPTVPRPKPEKPGPGPKKHGAILNGRREMGKRPKLSVVQKDMLKNMLLRRKRRNDGLCERGMKRLRKCAHGGTILILRNRISADDHGYLEA